MMIDCIEATSIPWCMVGMLTALPNTQLSRRLEKEGRMLHDVWRNEADGREMGMGGVYKEIVKNERVVNSEKFDEPWYPGEAVNTTTFDEAAGRTTLTMLLRYESKEARDMVLRSPMGSGVSASFDRLERLLTDRSST